MRRLVVALAVIAPLLLAACEGDPNFSKRPCPGCVASDRPPPNPPAGRILGPRNPVNRNP